MPLASLLHGIGVLGMKSMGDHLILESSTATPIESGGKGR